MGIYMYVSASNVDYYAVKASSQMENPQPVLMLMPRKSTIRSTLAITIVWIPIPQSRIATYK